MINLLRRKRHVPVLEVAVPEVDMRPRTFYHGTAAYLYIPNPAYRDRCHGIFQDPILFNKAKRPFTIEDKGLEPPFSRESVSLTENPCLAISYALRYCPDSIEIYPEYLFDKPNDVLGNLIAVERAAYEIKVDGTVDLDFGQPTPQLDGRILVYGRGGGVPRNLITGKYVITDPSRILGKLRGTEDHVNIWWSVVPQNLTFEELLPFLHYQSL